jgi:hypothetical protein
MVNGKFHSLTPLTLGQNVLGPFGYGISLVISTVDYIFTKDYKPIQAVPPLTISTDTMRSFHCITFLSNCMNNTMLSENKIVQQQQKATNFSIGCIKNLFFLVFCLGNASPYYV